MRKVKVPVAITDKHRDIAGRIKRRIDSSIESALQRPIQSNWQGLEELLAVAFPSEEAATLRTRLAEAEGRIDSAQGLLERAMECEALSLAFRKEIADFLNPSTGASK